MRLSSCNFNSFYLMIMCNLENIEGPKDLSEHSMLMVSVCEWFSDLLFSPINLHLSTLVMDGGITCRLLCGGE